MTTKEKTIIGISPGSRLIGFAIFAEGELLDWGVKTLKDIRPEDRHEKAKDIVLGLIERYGPDTITIKKLDTRRSSKGLLELADSFKALCKKKGVPVDEYSINRLETLLSPKRKIDKDKIAELMAEYNPVLFNDFEKAKPDLDEYGQDRHENTRKYYLRVFEAVALAFVSFRQSDR